MLGRYIAVGCYTVLIVVIGLLGHRKTKNFNDYLLGGGKVGPWMTAFSYGTAYFSAVLFIGFAGSIGWGFGFSGLWVALGNSVVGVLGVWLLLGNRIKQAALKYDVYTMPGFLEARFNSRFIRLFTSIAIFVFMIPYTAAVFMGLSYLFEVTFALPYAYVLLFMGVFTGVYLVLGGYKSMSMIDVFFGMIMTIGVVVLLVFTLKEGGGLPNIIGNLRNIDPKLTAAVGPPGFIPLASLVFLTSIAPFAMPQLVQKFYAVKDKKAIKIGMTASTVFAVLVTGTAYFIGSLTRLFLTPGNNPAAFNASGAPNFDALMPEMLSTVVPPGLSVIILLLILAASMSTLAALVLISSSTLTVDFYRGMMKPGAADKTLTGLMRFGSAFFIVLSMLLAMLRPAIIVTILAISWGAIASVFLGPFIWGILGRRINKAGALAASILGLATCLVLFVVMGPGKTPLAGSIGMIVSLAVPALFLPFLRGRAA
jgi:SSS family solute:Na+ symporter/sodium/proline symporter